MKNENNESYIPSRKEILEVHGRKESDVMKDEEGEYVMAEMEGFDGSLVMYRVNL